MKLAFSSVLCVLALTASSSVLAADTAAAQPRATILPPFAARGAASTSVGPDGTVSVTTGGADSVSSGPSGTTVTTGAGVSSSSNTHTEVTTSSSTDGALMARVPTVAFAGSALVAASLLLA